MAVATRARRRGRALPDRCRRGVRDGARDLAELRCHLPCRVRTGGRIRREQALEQPRCIRRRPDLAGHDEPWLRAAPGQEGEQEDAEPVEVVSWYPQLPPARARAVRRRAGCRLAPAADRLARRPPRAGARARAPARRRSPARGARARARGEAAPRPAARTSRAARAHSRPTTPARRSRRAGASPATLRQAASSAGPDRLCAVAGATGPPSTRPFIA